MYTYKIWDKKSPVSGVAAEVFIKEYKIKGGAVYLLYKDDVLMTFQPFKPNESGFIEMSEDDARDCAEQEIIRLIESETLNTGGISGQE